MNARSLVPSLIVILSAALAFGVLTKGHDWGDDFAGYISQASSIIHGTLRESVARTAFTMERSSRSYAPIAYPWGFPVLLAPVYLACGGLNIFCLKLLNIPLFALFLFVFFKFLVRRLLLVDSALVLSVLAFSPALLPFLNNVLSDITFLFFSTWSILLIEQHIVRPAQAQGSPGRNMWLGAVLFCAFFVRTNGILLVPTLFLTQSIVWWRRGGSKTEWGRVVHVAAIPYAVFGVLTVAVLLLFPGGEASYLTHFRGLSVEAVLGNLSTYFWLPVDFFDPIPFAEIFWGALLPFVIAGVARHYDNDFHSLTYVGLTLLLLILWPERQGLRYMYPLLPFLIYFGYRGMQTTALALAERYRRGGERLTRAVWVVVVALFIAASFDIARANVTHQRVPEDGPFDPVSTELFEWIRTRTPAESVVAFYKPRAMSVMTGRRALLIDRCDQLGRADYVVIRKQADLADQVRPVAVTTCNPSMDITRVFANQTFDVYRVRPTP